MNREALVARVREAIAEAVPLPGGGQTAQRHRRLFEVGLENLSLARLVEAHWDALAILAEAGREAAGGALYGVWAAEAPGKVLRLDGSRLSGTKPFCSGAGIVDRALVTVKEPEGRLIDIDVSGRDRSVSFDESGWKTFAFAETKTASATFRSDVMTDAHVVGGRDFYLQRPGFWHGACGPAACWAGGAAGLLDWAARQRRDDPHTLAHLGGMSAAVWSMKAALKIAGDEIDESPDDIGAAHRRALTVRHIVEQGCTEVVQRLTRAYGPYPLAMDEAVSLRIQELSLYVRQCHAERDLEALGGLTRNRSLERDVR